MSFVPVQLIGSEMGLGYPQAYLRSHGRSLGLLFVLLVVSFLLPLRGAAQSAPQIIQHPKNWSAPVGGSHTFTVSAIGDAPLSYQWIYNGEALNGATGNNLALANIQVTNAGPYQVMVSNAVGSVTSLVATLVVRATNDPAYPPPDGGWSYLFAGNAAAVGPSTALDGTWTRATNTLDSWGGDGRGAGNGLLGGVQTTNGVLTIEDAVFSGTSSSDNRRFYMLHDLSQENVANANTLLSDGVTLTFRARLTPPPPNDPLTELTNAPNGYINVNSGKGMFGIRQAGLDGMLVSFTLNNASEDASTSSSFNFNQAGLHMNTLNGNVRSAAVDPGLGTLNLLPINSSEFHEFWITVRDNGTDPGTHRVSVYVDGSTTSTMFNVTAGSGSESLSTITNYLAIGLPSTTQRGAYDIDFYGYAPGALVPAGYNDPVQIVAAPTNRTVALGEAASFTIAVSGTPPFSYQWFRDGLPISGATNRSYTTPPVTGSDDFAEFSVAVSNFCNVVTSTPPAVLRLLQAPVIVEQPQSQNVTNGDFASFTVVVDSAVPVAYHWRFNGAPISSGTNQVLSFGAVGPGNAGEYDVVVTNVAGSVTSAVALLTVRLQDFGDAPNSYSTLSAQNGARHLLGGGAFLGASVDAEPDGFDSQGVGDDSSASDDEDGVTFTSALRAGQTASLQVVASTAGVLNAWIDFNGEGAWAGAGEQICTNVALVAGTNALEFLVPAAATPGDTFGRFRFSTTSGLSFDGPAADGEVEDHALSIVPVADLGITTSDSADPAATGSQLSYAISLTNSGPSIATDVVITNFLQTGVTFVSANGDLNCNHNAGIVRCTLNSLAPQSTAALTLVVTPTTAGTVTNRAVATSAAHDPAVANNEFVEVTEIAAPPSIVTPPASLVVTQGDTAVLTISAAGSPELVYQWFFEATPLANATNTSLSLPNVQPGQSGAYTVRITNRVGSVVSSPAILTVLVPPAITLQPQNRTNNAGSEASLTVLATGSEPMSYRWYFGGGELGGQTNATLILSNIQKNQAGDYFAVASNPAGAATSIVATITVFEVDFGDAPSAYPTLTADNGARHLLVSGLHLGSAIDFEADGQPNGSALGDDTLSLDDEDGVDLAAPLLIGRTNSIRVVASGAGLLNAWLDWNGNGSWTDAGDQIVTNLPLVGGTNLVSLPVAADVLPTNTFTRFRFSSAADLSYDGPATDGEVEDYAVTILSAADLGITATRAPNPVAIGSNLVYDIFLTNKGPSAATGVTLSNIHSGNISVVSALPSQGSCTFQGSVVTCSLGTLPANSSATMQLTVIPNVAQTITNSLHGSAAVTDTSVADNTLSLITEVQAYPFISIHPQSRTVTNGATAQFSVTASGTALRYQWRFGASNLSGETNSILNIPNVQTSNAGSYSVVITNGVGAIISEAATLTVLVPAQITSQPTNRTVVQGTTATFTVVATGTLPLGYQWFFEGVEIPGAVSATLTISNVQPEHEGAYRVLVSNGAGSELSQPATLSILVPPSITIQPSSRTNYAGATTVFSVTASGTQPLGYRWFSNNVAIANATNSTLTLTNLAKAFQGPYFVLITNIGGSITSSVAQLTVIEADFGDAPDGYPTLLLFAGARHQIVPGIRLGAAADFEVDGQPNAAATGDDLAVTDDEDGVYFTSPIVPGQNCTVGVLASTNGYIDAWIDFDQNGSWADFPDQILTRVPVVTGSNSLTYAVPSFAVPSNSFARFRFSTAGNLPSDGPASDGEVEDYAVAIVRAADLSLGIAASPQPAPAFTNLTYSIGLSNLGPSSASSVRLTNALPANVAFVSAIASQGNCAHQAGLVTCQLGTIASGSSVLITLVVAPQRSGLLTNRFVAACTEIDPNPANHSIAHLATVIGQPTALRSTNPLPIADNGISTPYPSTITVSTLTASVHKVTVTLSNITHDFPADLDVLLAGPNGRSVVLLSDGGSGAPANGVTLTFDDESPIIVQENSRLIDGVFKPTNYGTPDPFPAPAPSGPYSNQLAVFQGINPNGVWSLYVVDDEAMDAGQIAAGWSLEFTTLEPLADTAVAVRAQPEPVAVESNVTYIITVTNRGPSAASSIVVTDVLPGDVTFISANSSLGSCSHTNGVVTCAIPTLARNSGGNITLMARPNRGGSITNRVFISSIDADLVVSNNSASVVSTVKSVVDLALSMTQTPEPAGFGQDLIYTLRVTNRGPNRAHMVTIRDPLPAAVTFVGATASQGNCSSVAGVVQCSLGEMAALTAATATITGRVNFIGLFTNTATVVGDEIDLIPADNEASDVTTGVGLFGFANNSVIVAPSQGAASPYPSTITVSGLTGEVYEVAVTLSNMSHTFPDDLDILLVGPEGQNVLLMSDAGDGVPMSNVTLTFSDTAAALLPDSSGISAGQFRATQYAPADVFPAPAPGGVFGTNFGVFRNTDPNGVWSLFVYDDTSPNNGGIFRWRLSVATLNPIADLTVAGIASRDPVSVGSNFIYTISTTNMGPAPAGGVKLTNTLPSSVTFVNAAPETGACTHDAGTIVCDFGDLAAGARARVAILVTPTSTGLITNETVVAGQTRDHRPSNNRVATVTLVEAPPVVVAQPQSLIRTNGDSVAFNISVSGTPPFGYQWQHNDVDLANATNATLIVPNVQWADAGPYRARVTNRVGSTLSDLANLTVRMRPVISAITNLTIDEDNATPPIQFRVEDVETQAAALTVAAISSNPALVPAQNITLTGSGTNRVAQILPATNAFGTATITLIVQDTDGITNISRFELEVRSVNDPPTIAPVVDQTTEEDTPLTINLAVGDVETGAENLTLTVASSNPSLVATNTALFGGSNSNRTVRVFPTTDQSGNALLTVVVSDGDGASASNSFNLTVVAVNDPPGIDSILPIVVDEDAPPMTLTLAGIGPGATNENQPLIVTAQSSNPLLVAHPNVVYASPNSTGLLALTFATNAHGTATISVHVDDGGPTNAGTTRTFEVTVRSVNDLPRISSAADISISEDGVAEVTVTVEDLETPAAQLTVTGGSSNSVLLPATNIVSSGDTTQRVVTIKPATNQFGSTTVALTVNDAEGGSATTTFLLEVAPANDLPTIDDIADVNLPEDSGLQTILLTNITPGATNEDQALTVSITAGVSSVITNVSLNYTSPAPVAALSFSTISNASGTAQLTVTVDDGGASNNVTTRVFNVNISPVNDLPLISAIADQSIDEDTTTASLPFAVRDVETLDTDLVVSAISSDTQLVPLTNILVTGSGAVRHVMVVPAPDRFGTAVVTLAVSDTLNGTNASSFTVEVRSINDLPFLSAITPQVTSEDVPLAVPFVAGDVETSELDLSLTASNLSLLGAIQFAGSGTNRTVTITPLSNYFGSGVVTLTATDDDGVSVSSRFYMVVNAINDPPSITGIADQQTDEGASLGPITFSIADIETGTQGLTLSAASSDPMLMPASNIVFGGADSARTVTITPAPTRSGAAAITLTVRDEAGDASTVTFLVNVSPRNDAPQLSAVAAQTIVEDATLDVPFTVSDIDSPLNSVIVEAVSSASALLSSDGITVTGDGPDRTLHLTPEPNASGSAIVVIVVTDGQSATTNQFELTVVPVNDPPTLDTPPTAFLNENHGTHTMTLSGIGSGAPDESQALALSAVSQNPSLVSVVSVGYTNPASSGTLTLSVAGNATGTAMVDITVNDGGASNNLTVRSFTIEVRPVDDPPQIAAVPPQSTSEDTPIAVPFTVADPDTPLQNLILTAASTNESLIATTNIAVHGSGAERILAITPSPHQFGTTAIILAANDGTSSRTQAVVLTVSAVNDPPGVSLPDNVAITEGTPAYVVPVSGIHPGAANESQTVTLTAASSNPGLIPPPSITYTNPSANAFVRLTPAATGVGTAVITLTANDGGASNNLTTRTFTVYVRQSDNASPTISAVSDQSTAVNTPVTVDFQAGDRETAAGSLILTATSSNPGLVPQPNFVFGGSGSNRTLRVTPASGQSGSAFITILVTDPGGASASERFTLNVTSPPPVLALSAIADQSMPEDGLLSIPFTIQHPFPELSVLAGVSTNTSLIANTNILFDGSGSNRTVTLRPSLNTTGQTRITINATNGSSVASRFFTVTVTPVNDPPTLDSLNDRVADSPGSPNVNLDVPLSGIGSGAPNESQTLTVTATSSAATIATINAITYTSPAANGTVRLRLVRDAIGSTVITVNVSDGQATTSRTFTLFLKPLANTIPTISSIVSPSIAEDTATAALPFTIGDANTPASLLTLRATSLNTSLVPASNIVFGGSGANRNVTVTPLLNMAGAAPIVVSVTDTNFGSAYTNFTVTVSPVNDPPSMATLTNRTMLEDSGPLIVPLLLGDVETPAGFLTLSNASSNELVVPRSNIVFSGTGSNRVALITPVRDQSGSSTLTITARDPEGASVARQFTLNVSPVNDAPTLGELNDMSMHRGGTQSVPLTGITSGALNENQTLTITAISSQPGNVPNPQVVYTSPQSTGSLILTANPAAGGTAVITVTVTDGGAPTMSATQTFTVSILSPGNAVPIIAGLSNVTILEDATLGPISFTVADAETPAGNLVLAVSSSNPTLVPDANIALGGSGTNRSLTITPVANASGTATITVSAADPDFGWNSTNFTLTVTAQNDAPALSAVADQTTPEDTPTSALPITIGDADHSAGSVTLAALSSNPTLVAVSNVFFGGSGSNRTVTVVPALNQTGLALISVRATDPAGASNEISFTVAVTAANDAPSVASIADQVMDEDTSLGPLPFSIIDPEPGTLTLSIESSNPALLPPSNVVSSGSGQNQTLTLTPLADQFGEAVVTVIVADDSGARGSNSFLVTVRPVNDPPTLNAIANLQLPSGAASQTVTLTGISSGAANESDLLAISAVSSSPALIPTVAFSGSTGTLSLTPTPGMSGSVTINVTVNDGQAQTTQPFTVTIEHSPSATALADVHTDEDVPAGPIALLVSDGDTPPETISMTARSSNPGLITASNIVFSGSGTNRAVTLTPNRDQHGFSFITLVSSDDHGNASSNTFAFVVHPVNDPPVISAIPDQDTATNQPAGPIAFAIGDIETSAQQLWITASSSDTTLAPLANISLAGTGAVRTITVQPTANRAGETTITVHLTDSNGASASESFLLRVTDSLVAPFITTQPAGQTVLAGGSVTFLVTAGGSHPMTYQWRHGTTNLPSATSPLLTIATVAPANAGNYSVVVSNSAGFVVSDIAQLVVPMAVNISSISWVPGSIMLSFETLNGVTYAVESSDTLAPPSWTILQTLGGNGNTATVIDPSPGGPTRFYRIRAE